MALKASNRMGLPAMATFSGALAWPFLYPWPQRPAGLIDVAFDELARPWRPLLDAAEQNGVDICYEIDPARICSTERPLRCSSTGSAGMRGATCCMTRRTTCCSASTTWITSTSTTSG